MATGPTLLASSSSLITFVRSCHSYRRAHWKLMFLMPSCDLFTTNITRIPPLPCLCLVLLPHAIRVRCRWPMLLLHHRGNPVVIRFCSHMPMTQATLCPQPMAKISMKLTVLAIEAMQTDFGTRGAQGPWTTARVAGQNMQKARYQLAPALVPC